MDEMDRMYSVRMDGMRAGARGAALLALLLLTQGGCVVTQQETPLAGEVHPVEAWGKHHVLWVETGTGEHIDFDSAGGRILPDAGAVLPAGRVVGTGVDGRDYSIPLAELTLLRTSSRQRNTAGEVVATAAVTMVGLAIYALTLFRT